MKEYWDKRYAKQGRKTVGNVKFSGEEFQSRSIQIELLAGPIFLRVFKKGGRILDLGCGYGRLSKVLLQLGYEVYGIDVASWATEEAKIYAQGGSYRVYDGITIPYPAGMFDGVLTWTVLQHIPPGEILKVAHEIVQVLKHGGGLFCLENTTSCVEDKTHIWFRRYDEYLSLFRLLTPTMKSELPDLDGTGEIHTAMGFAKWC
jgi:2-polyprenyl-3-methyl-5-hydroxy-6-metoxy-1,4-benzoquinol methylase